MDEAFCQNLRRTREELERMLQDPEMFHNPTRYREIARRYKEVTALLERMDRKEKLERELEEAKALIEEETDPEVRIFLAEEVGRLQREIEALEWEIRRALLPRDPEDEGNAVVEIRAGAGGEEAALFARDLFRMYQRYAEKKGWRISITDLHETDLGGVREIVFLVEGKGAYGRLKFESGVHRVQRIPITESGGRIHTSTASVVVMPEWEEIEIEVRPEDLKIETFRASGPGGQHVNVTDSAVRITHVPTGIVVSVQDERSQHKNRAKALRILKARLYDLIRQEQAQKMDSIRRTYIGTGDRSEKIRTYNFPQNRVTDHRIGLTLYILERVLDGELDPLLETLLEAEERKKLEELSTSQ